MKKKLVIFSILFSLLSVSILSGETYEQYMYGDQAYKTPKDEGGGGGDEPNVQNGGDPEKEREVREAEDAAKAAEDAAAEAAKDYTEAKDRVDKARKKLKSDKQKLKDLEKTLEIRKEKEDYSSTDLAYIEETQKEINEAKDAIEQDREEYNQAKEEEKNTFKELKDAAKNMQDAYNHLADVYEEYGYTGDPVRIDTGEFICSYDDFVAKDHITNFTISRKHISQNYDSSFGPNWTCPLDARLVRGQPEALPEDYLDALGDSIVAMQEMAAAYKKYNDEYPKYPKDYLKYNQIAAEINVKLLNDLYVVEQIHDSEEKSLRERNKYSTYGKYTDFSTYNTIADVIFFTDSDGSEYIFGKNGNEWETYGIFQSKVLKLVKQDSNGYEIEYADGRRKSFDKYGILTGEKDRNGNQTTYYSENGRINKIKLATGEELKITRDFYGHITQISGPVSGTANYTYLQNRILSAQDNFGVKVNYFYDSDGNILIIEKADKSKVYITYEKDSYTGRTVCKYVTNENGQTEFFNYNYKKGQVSHLNISGNREEYELTSDGFITKVTDEAGNIIQISPDSNGLITAITKNGKQIEYTYDEDYHPVQAKFATGGNEKMTYNKFGQLSSLTDRDGFTQSYTYDSNGNITAVYYCGTLISSATYYTNGLLRSLTENGITYNYEYNNHGSMKKRSWVDSYGRTNTETWEFDSYNRVILHTQASGETTKYNYNDGKSAAGKSDSEEIITKGNSLETRKVYDSRNRVISLTQKDLLTGKSFTLDYTYDGCGNVIQVNLDGKPYVKYSYNARGNLTEYTVFVDDKQAKTSYTYNSFGYFTGETVTVDKLSPVTKYTVSYSTNGTQKVVKINCGGATVQTYYYNDDERLVKTVSQSGYTKNISYSTAGRLSSISDSNGNVTSYKYNTDGTYQVNVKNAHGYSTMYTYNLFGKLSSIKDQYNQLEKYEYDSYGRLIQKVTPTGIKEYSYDAKDRCISMKIKSKAGQVEYQEYTNYDDAHRTVSKYKGEPSGQHQLIAKKTYDAWNHIVKEETVSETYEYEYDWFGNLLKESDSRGNSIEYKYSAANKLIEKKDVDNVIQKFERLSSGKLTKIKTDGIQTFSAKYDNAGRTTQIVNALGNKLTYSYDADSGFVSLVGRYDTGNTNYTTEVTAKDVTVVDANGKKTVYKIGTGGNVVEEVDPLGNTFYYSYDKKGRLIEKKYPTGCVETYEYDDVANTVTANSTLKDKRVFYKNALGKITKIEAQKSTLTFDYDKAGRLIKTNDTFTNVPIEYFYDAAGNCIQKKSEYFDYHYEYDRKGNTTKISDTVSGIWVKIERDVRGQITMEKYSNGVTKATTYNSLGTKSGVCIKNRFGAVISSQDITFDENNKISMVVNEKGEAWKYDYDRNGRLVKVTSPYTEEQRKYALEEAVECGLSIKNENPDGIALKLKNGSVQYSWWEEYTYTKTGAVQTTKNPFGTINYKYDSKNRIVSKNAANTESGGITITWNGNDQLKSIKTPKKRILFDYGLIDSMNYKNVKMLEDDSSLTFMYFYDGLGRCVQESCGEYNVSYVYDGFTDNKVLATPSYYGIYLFDEPPASGIKEYKFRWIDDDKKYFAAEEIKGMSEEVKTTAIENYSEFNLSDYRPYTILTIDGKSCVNMRIDGTYENERDPQYLISDYRGYKIGVLSENGDYSVTDFYDAWGVNLNASETVQEIGVRFYVPALKSFTTQDPARDGANWYSYCPCDPINYQDYGGTIKRKNSNTPAEDARYEGAVSEFLAYDRNEALENGRSQDLPNDYDCHDVSCFIDKSSREEAGLENSNSKIQNEFDEKKDALDKKKEENSDYSATSDEDPRNVATASSYWEEGWEDSYRKVGDSYEDMSENNLGPGTVIVFRTEDGAKQSHDHVMTVLAVDYDEQGNIVGIVIIEGHVKDPTNIDYILFDSIKSNGAKGIWSLANWKGLLVGFFEIERNDTIPMCQK